MSLSDDERKRLEQLEEQLSGDDPRLARKLEAGEPAGRFPRWRGLAVFALLAGLTLVIVGAATHMPVIGVIGFVLECAGAYWLPVGPGPDSRNTGSPAHLRNRDGNEFR